MSTTAIQSASSLQMDYMKLLITELQNQNPLDPLTNKEMTSQLVQLTQLSHTEQMNNTFAEILAATNRNYANSLIGKNVSYYAPDLWTGGMERQMGEVSEVYSEADGENLLVVDRQELAIEQIADSLIGRRVSFLYDAGGGIKQWATGTINQIYNDAEGQDIALIDEWGKVPFDEIKKSLVGQEVLYQLQTETGEVQNKIATIEKIYKRNNKNFFLVGYPLGLDEIISVAGI